LIFLRLFFLCLIALTVFQPAVAQDNPILTRMAAFSKAYNAQDATAISTFYTDKAALLPPRSKALVGRQAIANHYGQAFNNGVEALIYKVIEIDQTGPGTAVEIGETRVKFKAQTIAGRSIHVWKNVNGEWFIHRDMYHVLAVGE